MLNDLDIKFDGSMQAVVPLKFVVDNFLPARSDSGYSWSNWFAEEYNESSKQIREIESSIVSGGGINETPVVLCPQEFVFDYDSSTVEVYPPRVGNGMHRMYVLNKIGAENVFVQFGYEEYKNSIAEFSSEKNTSTGVYATNAEQNNFSGAKTLEEIVNFHRQQNTSAFIDFEDVDRELVRDCDRFVECFRMLNFTFSCPTQEVVSRRSNSLNDSSSSVNNDNFSAVEHDSSWFMDRDDHLIDLCSFQVDNVWFTFSGMFGDSGKPTSSIVVHVDLSPTGINSQYKNFEQQILNVAGQFGSEQPINMEGSSVYAPSKVAVVYSAANLSSGAANLNVEGGYESSSSENNSVITANASKANNNTNNSNILENNSSLENLSIKLWESVDCQKVFDVLSDRLNQHFDSSKYGTIVLDSVRKIVCYELCESSSIDFVDSNASSVFSDSNESSVIDYVDVVVEQATSLEQ